MREVPLMRTVLRLWVITIGLVTIILIPHGFNITDGMSYAAHPHRLLQWPLFTDSISQTIQEFKTGRAINGSSLYLTIGSHLTSSIVDFLISLLIILTVGLTKGFYDGLRFDNPTWGSTLSGIIQFALESLPDFFIITTCELVTILLWIHKGLSIMLVGTYSFWWGSVFPACLAAVVPTMYFARMVRMEVEEQIRQHYVLTAQSKGIQRCAILIRHVTPNLFPVIRNTITPLVGMMIGGYVLVDYLLARDHGLVGGLLIPMGEYGVVLSDSYGLTIPLNSAFSQPYDPAQILLYACIFAVLLFSMRLFTRTSLFLFGDKGVSNPFSSELRDVTNTGRWSLIIGTLLLGVLVVLGMIGGHLGLPPAGVTSPFEVFGQDDIRMPPFPPLTPHHLAGTDSWGGDLLSNGIHGIVPTLLYLFVCTCITLAISIVLSVIGSVWRIRLIRLFNELWHQAFTIIPGVIACLLLLDIPDVYWFGSHLGPNGTFILGTAHMIVFIAIICLTEIGRVASNLQFVIDEILNKTFIEASRVSGNSNWGTFRWHAIRPFIGAMLEQSTIVASRVLILTASLGFFGHAPMLSLQENDHGTITVHILGSDWASMIAQNSHDWFRAPWVPFVPALLISYTALSLNLLRIGLSHRNKQISRRNRKIGPRRNILRFPIRNHEEVTSNSEKGGFRVSRKIDEDLTNQLDILMQKYGDDVWNLAFVLTRNRDQAFDVSQDVFIKAYENLSSYQGHSSIKTWLLAITRNAAIDYRRSAFVRRVLLVSEVRPDVASPSAERIAIGRLSADEIWGLVLTLPLKLREVLVLHANHHLGAEEISSILGISTDTVHARLYRARKKMNTLLEGCRGNERSTVELRLGRTNHEATNSTGGLNGSGSK